MAIKWILIYKILFFIISSFCASHSRVTDTLKQGDNLNSSNQLVSKNGLFTLGFYKLDSGSSNYSYLAIWYTGYTDPVWLANRNTPIAKDSGILTIDQTGKVKITHDGGNLIELYSSPSTTNITAILNDTGNFIFKEANTEHILWQSFNNPTDTLLPGMKLGINHKTGQKWSLTSWLTMSIPTPGAFTLEWDPTRRELIVKRRGVIFWTSGVLNDDKKFDNIPLLDDMNNNYYFENVTTTDEEYLRYGLVVDKFNTPKHRWNVSKWLLSSNGDISDLEGRPMILFSDSCNGSNKQNGCEKWRRPTCRSDGDTMVLRAGGFLDTKISENASISFSDCKDMCWNNCDCVGVLNNFYSSYSRCVFGYGNFTPDEEGRTSTNYYIILQDPQDPHRSGGKKWKWIWIMSVAIAVALIMILLGVLFYLRRRRLEQKEKSLLELMTSDRPSDANELEDDGNKGHNLNVYSIASIMAATNCFSSENKLGEGGFGPVYKGKLANGREIAVKRLSRRSRQGLVEFKNELILIAKLQHVNLVRLLGCCIQGEERMLVYEYMPNKSLDSFIFDQSKRGLLDWKKRLNIIQGIAQGLLYLHQYSRVRIIHRDLKVGNILLDEDMNPKISDFGMARIFNINELEANTNKVVGTYGYMSPEYAMEGIFSVKSDVFSFGVMVLEIVSGRKNRSRFQFDRPLNLVGYAWELWKQSAALELLDPKLSDSYSKDQVLRCINVGLLCVEENASHRPTMAEVTYMLTSEAIQLPMPKQPAFSTSRSIVETDFNEGNIENCSINGRLSTSVMDAR